MSARVAVRGGVVGALALFALVGTGCVDGTTPDCSDAAARCGPDYDAYPPTDSAPQTDAPSDGAATAETGSEPVPEAGPDAPRG